MKNIDQLKENYVRCTKAYLIVDEKNSMLYLWRPFVQESSMEPVEVFHHNAGNKAVSYFLKLLSSENGIESDSSRANIDRVYRFNCMVEKSKEQTLDAYLCQTLDELRIVNIEKGGPVAKYSVQFPKERVLFNDGKVKSLRNYVDKNYDSLCLGQKLFEEDYFQNERERIQGLSKQSFSQINSLSKEYFLHPRINLDFSRAEISLSYGQRTENLSLQPLPKAWLMYFMMNDKKPLLYSDILSDRSTLEKYYKYFSLLSDQKRGRHKKDDSSLKPGLIIRKINAELTRCCDSLGLIPGSVAIMRCGLLKEGAKQVDVPKRLVGADIHIIIPEL